MMLLFRYLPLYFIPIRLYFLRLSFVLVGPHELGYSEWKEAESHLSKWEQKHIKKFLTQGFISKV